MLAGNIFRMFWASRYFCALAQAKRLHYSLSNPFRFFRPVAERVSHPIVTMLKIPSKNLYLCLRDVRSSHVLFQNSILVFRLTMLSGFNTTHLKNYNCSWSNLKQTKSINCIVTHMRKTNAKAAWVRNLNNHCKWMPVWTRLNAQHKIVKNYQYSKLPLHMKFTWTKLPNTECKRL